MKNSKIMIKIYALLLGFVILSSGCKKDDETVPVVDETIPVAEDNVTFSKVSLSSGQEVPSNSSTASGTLEAQYEKNSNTLSYTINYTGLTPSGMHFHKAAVGVAGDVAQEVKGPFSSGMTGTLKLTDAEEADLLDGLWYLNIHTAAVPAGEIRGQVVTENIVVFSNIKLDGKQEVPSNMETSTGVFNGTYDKTTKKLNYTVTLDGVTAASMHIHNGAIGTNGDVVTELQASGETAALTAAQETDLFAGNLYVNVHSTEFASGEIRGQIVPENQVAFASILSGANEVPATTSTATGTIYTVYDKSAKKLSYNIGYNGLEPTAMHFHKAAAGENGGVELEVAGPYSSGMTGSVMLTDAQAADLLNGLWYLNVHTAAEAGGEIRAQLVK